MKNSGVTGLQLKPNSGVTGLQLKKMGRTAALAQSDFGSARTLN
jgi:hypothetical protein